MENTILLEDSVKMVRQTIEVLAPIQTQSVLDIIKSVATVIIAVANLGLVFYIFKKNNHKDYHNIEINRKLNLLKTLVLDYNMKYFYQFFEDVNTKTQELKIEGLQIEQKQVINEYLADYGKIFRQRFTDSLLAINRQLYDNTLETMDSLLDSLTNDIFDGGVNLSHGPKFEELITKRIIETKTKIIKILFDYSGE